MSDIKKVVLAYSGGMDTSVILEWLQDVYKCEVVTFTADLGQGEELEPARAKALKAGIKPKNIYIDDVREEFVRDFVFPMFGAYALKPGIKVIAPWREWDLMSREKLMAYAEKHGIPIDMKHKKGGSPYSMDANLLHISYEGRHLEDPAAEAEESMWRWTVSPEKAPNKAEYLDLEFVKGDLVSINGTKMKAHELLAKLNELGGKHGIGRLDLVENRYVGMKSRGCYETPGGTILLRAHRAIESITLDREVAHLKDDLMPRYASLVYNGYWWAPERKALQTLIDHTQQTVNGTVRLKLYKGNVIVVGRDSKTDSLFDSTIATFEDDAGAYDQRDAGGFIKLNALRMRIAANLTAKKAGKPAAAAKKVAPKKAAAAKPAAKPAAKAVAKPAA